MFKKRAENTLAIDLALDAVRVIEVKPRKSDVQVAGFASQSVAAGPLDSLPERQLTALESVLNANRMKARRCVAAIPTALVVTRSVAVDTIKTQTTEEQIRAALQNCLPFDAKDLTFDHWATGDPRATTRTREVLVVATRASVVQRYLQGLEKLGLTCAHLDVAPCAMATLIGRASSAGDALAGTVVLGETTGYFAIVDKQRVLFWRPFDIPAAAQKVISAVQTGLDRVGEEISKCVSHMVGSMHLDNLSELLVFGHGSNDAVFTDYLKNRFHLPVRSPSPFDAFTADAFSPELRNAVQENAATHYAVAVGLAMQPVGVTNHG